MKNVEGKATIARGVQHTSIIRPIAIGIGMNKIETMPHTKLQPWKKATSHPYVSQIGGNSTAMSGVATTPKTVKPSHFSTSQQM